MTITTAAARVEVPRFTSTGLREDAQHLLLLQARGETGFEVAGAQIVLTEHCALWLPAGTEHRFSTEPDSALLPMFFDIRGASPSPEPMVVQLEPADETLCLALVASQYSLIQPAEALQQMVLDLLIARSAQPTGVPLPRSSAARHVARHVMLDPADPRTLAEWANELHVSTRTLERQFAAETGSVWVRWRQRYRIGRAAQLLSTTTMPVTIVARQVGFTSPSAFARAFREHHGATPAEYRAARVS